MTRTPTETMLLEALEAWIAAIDARRDFEIENPNNTTKEWWRLLEAVGFAEDAARRAISAAKGEDRT